MGAALTPEEIPDKLGLHRIRDRNWCVPHARCAGRGDGRRYVQPCVATTGDGLTEGLTWLSSNYHG